MPPEEFLDWCYKSPDTCLHKYITIGNLRAVEVTKLIDFGAGWPKVYIFRDKNVFIIGYAQTSWVDKEKYIPIFEKIVSTFKPLNQEV